VILYNLVSYYGYDEYYYLCFRVCVTYYIIYVSFRPIYFSLRLAFNEPIRCPIENPESRKSRVALRSAQDVHIMNARREILGTTSSCFIIQRHITFLSFFENRDKVQNKQANILSFYIYVGTRDIFIYKPISI
jgi:hypothetical protein